MARSLFLLGVVSVGFLLVGCGPGEPEGRLEGSSPGTAAPSAPAPSAVESGSASGNSPSSATPAPGTPEPAAPEEPLKAPPATTGQ
jgi:hypothetical protein